MNTTLIFVLLAASAVGIGILWISRRNFRAEGIYGFAVIFILTEGLFSLFLQPVLNIPDETVHFARAELISRGKIFIDPGQTEYESIQSVLDLERNVKVPYFKSDIKGKDIDASPVTVDHHYVVASNDSCLYFPQAVGILIAKGLSLDAIWMLWLARLVNLMCYALIIGLALKVTGALRFPLFYVAAFPICVHQAASCSPDALINSVSILLISFFIRMRKADDGTLTAKHMVIFALLSGFVAVSKITNIFLAGLILLVPKEKFAAKRYHVLQKCALIFAIIVIGAAHYRFTSLFPEDVRPHTIENHINASGQIAYIFGHFFTWLKDFLWSSFYNGYEYLRQMAAFGWLDYQNDYILLIMGVFFIKICLQEKMRDGDGLNLSWPERIYAIFLALGIYLSTNFALYLIWSPVGSSSVYGVQGRYFIPMTALAAVVLSSRTHARVRKEKTVKSAKPYAAAAVKLMFDGHYLDIAAMLCTNGMMIANTLSKYY